MHNDFYADIPWTISYDDRCDFLLNLASSYASKCSDTRVILKDDLKAGEGRISEYAARSFTVTLGVREVFDASCTDPKHFVAAVVGLNHEMAHRNQVTRLSREDTPLSRCILLNRYACKISGEYEDGIELANYWKQPYEIAAQYEAIKISYGMFAVKYGDDLANRIMCAYANDRVFNAGIGFVQPKKPFEDISEIYRAFEKCFDRHKSSHKPVRAVCYTGSEPMRDDYYLNCPDIRATTKKLCSKAFDQDVVLFKIYLLHTSEGMNMESNDDIVWFRDIDLSKDSRILSNIHNSSRKAVLSDLVDDFDDSSLIGNAGTDDDTDRDFGG